MCKSFLSGNIGSRGRGCREKVVQGNAGQGKRRQKEPVFFKTKGSLENRVQRCQEKHLSTGRGCEEQEVSGELCQRKETSRDGGETRQMLSGGKSVSGRQEQEMSRANRIKRKWRHHGKGCQEKEIFRGGGIQTKGGHKGLPRERDVKRRDLRKVDANNGFGNQVVWLRSYRPLIS